MIASLCSCMYNYTTLFVGIMSHITLQGNAEKTSKLVYADFSLFSKVVQAKYKYSSVNQFNI